MKQRIDTIAAPVGMSPGGYIAQAYADRIAPSTATVALEANRIDGRWAITLQWDAPSPQEISKSEPGHFCDAAAIIVPSSAASPWVTMGAPDMPVSGVLWRAGSEALQRIRSEGLGTVERSDPPSSWTATNTHSNGRWLVAFDLDWPLLDRVKLIGLAVWRGAARERASLKSVSPGWISVDG